MGEQIFNGFLAHSRNFVRSYGLQPEVKFTDDEKVFMLFLYHAAAGLHFKPQTEPSSFFIYLSCNRFRATFFELCPS
jgi:hypothetical protein